MTSRVWTDVDFERDGRQLGWLYLPHSVTRSGYGHLTTPVAVLRNGNAGPTVLLMGGNHGDEYEGQVALARLIRTLDPARLTGRLIVLPMANAPAAAAGVRVSPHDGGNLNRIFPGDADGTPTSAMAHYYATVLFPLANAFIDLHSGGTSLNYLPFASYCRCGDALTDARSHALLKAFGAPLSIAWDAMDHRMAETEASRQRLAAIGGEFGGGATVTPAGLAVVERGLSNALAHLGLLPPNSRAQTQITRWLEIPGSDFYVFSTSAGVFEPLVELGQNVAAGDPCGLIHYIEEPLREPVLYRFAASGLVVCKRQPARVERGDCLAHLARDMG
jgi:predicted deacylase